MPSATVMADREAPDGATRVVRQPGPGQPHAGVTRANGYAPFALTNQVPHAPPPHCAPSAVDAACRSRPPEPKSGLTLRSATLAVKRDEHGRLLPNIRVSSKLVALHPCIVESPGFRDRSSRTMHAALWVSLVRPDHTQCAIGQQTESGTARRPHLRDISTPRGKPSVSGIEVALVWPMIGVRFGAAFHVALL